MKFLIAQFQQESNSFSPVSCTMEMFRSSCLATGEALISQFENTRTEVGGFIRAVRDIQGEIIPSVAASSVSCGPVTNDVMEYVLTKIIADVHAAGKVDCILLCLHGAMLSESHWDGTGYFLEELKKRLKTEILTAGSLDFHANLTQRMLHNADILVGYKTYPHVDLFETGYRTAEIAIRTLAGECRPVMHMCKLPMILNGEASQTSQYPMKMVIEQAKEIEQQPGVIAASVFQVQSWLNVEDVGCACLVVSDHSKETAQKFSVELAKNFWQLRHEFRFDLTPVGTAIQRAKENKKASPVIFADSADGTGSGAPGDSTAILEELLAQKVALRTYLSVVDPEAVQHAIETGIGNTGRFLVGGKTGGIGSKPIWITGKVKTLSDGSFVFKGPQSTGRICERGRTAVIQVLDIHIVITENSVNNWDPEFYRSLGLEPEDAGIVIVKSPAAFRAAYADITQEAYIIDVPGASSANLKSLPFDKISRPMYPFEEFEYEVSEEC